MSNVNVCGICGIEVFVGVDSESGILIGYCDCPVVPEVDVFVGGLDFLELSPESQVLADKAEDYEMNKCIGDQEYDWRDMPRCIEGVNDVFCDKCGVFGPEVCLCYLPVYCVVCEKCTCDGKCDDRRVEIEDEDFVYVYEEAEVLVAEDGPEPRHEEAWSFSNDIFMVMVIIVSFFGILCDIATRRNNDPKLVIAWYAFCGYLILSYTAVILWFVL